MKMLKVKTPGSVDIYRLEFLYPMQCHQQKGIQIIYLMKHVESTKNISASAESF